MEEPSEVPVEAAPADELPPVVPQAAAVAGVREQDRLMPIANVVRIMRRVLPANAKISDDAKELIQECVSEFISFVTGEANDRCHSEHRKTVTADDIVWAMERLGFDNYAAPVETFVQRMRDWEHTVRASGSRAKQNRAPNGPAPPAPMAALPGMQFQETPLPHGYGVPPQVPFNTDPQFGDQHNMFVGEPSVAAASYGEHAPVTGAGETSSANEEPAAAATTPPPQYPN